MILTASKLSARAIGLFLLAAIPAAGPLTSAQPNLTRFEFTQVHMGTEFKIVLYARDAEMAATASDAAFHRIAALDAIMSDYNPRSELMSLCQQAGGPPVVVSDDLFRVLTRAQFLAERSQGAFDVTVGPLVRLWRQARGHHQMPDAASLAQARELVNYKNLRLDPVKKTVQLLKPGMLLDLGGIAKGYAADEAIAALQAHGIQRALVGGAGDIRASAPPPGRKGWVIAIAPLDPVGNSADRFFLLHDGAVSTSGDAEQHVEIGGVRYSHIVNPKTGLGLTAHSSVTVVAPNGMTSDSLATCVSVLGPRRGLDLVRSLPGTGVLFVLETGQGVRSYTAHFPRLASPDEVREDRSNRPVEEKFKQ
jgi:thiamine biosynthesis lipoprotein